MLCTGAGLHPEGRCQPAEHRAGYARVLVRTCRAAFAQLAPGTACPGLENQRSQLLLNYLMLSRTIFPVCQHIGAWMSELLLTPYACPVRLMCSCSCCAAGRRRTACRRCTSACASTWSSTTAWRCSTTASRCALPAPASPVGQVIGQLCIASSGRWSKEG